MRERQFVNNIFENIYIYLYISNIYFIYLRKLVNNIFEFAFEYAFMLNIFFVLNSSNFMNRDVIKLTRMLLNEHFLER